MSATKANTNIIIGEVFVVTMDTGGISYQASDPRRRIPRRGRPTPGIHGTRHGRDTK